MINYWVDCIGILKQKLQLFFYISRNYENPKSSYDVSKLTSALAATIRINTLTLVIYLEIKLIYNQRGRKSVEDSTEHGRINCTFPR